MWTCNVPTHGWGRLGSSSTQDQGHLGELFMEEGSSLKSRSTDLIELVAKLHLQHPASVYPVEDGSARGVWGAAENNELARSRE